MRFGVSLHHISNRILMADLHLGVVFLSRVDLSYTCICLCVRLEDTPTITLLVSRKRPEDPQVLGFHLSLPMGFHDSAPFLYISTETVADMTIATLGNQHVVPVNPLEMES